MLEGDLKGQRKPEQQIKMGENMQECMFKSPSHRQVSCRKLGSFCAHLRPFPPPGVLPEVAPLHRHGDGVAHRLHLQLPVDGSNEFGQ